MTSPPDELLDERSDPHVRSVLEDWSIEHGFVATRLGVAILMVTESQFTTHSEFSELAGDADHSRDAINSAEVPGTVIDCDAVGMDDDVSDMDDDVSDIDDDDASKIFATFSSFVNGHNALLCGGVE